MLHFILAELTCDGLIFIKNAAAHIAVINAHDCPANGCLAGA